jgi:uncharacterized protein YdaU (DUF1376 family)
MAKKKTNGKDPAVLLYTQDFIVGTITMTHEQRGKYILLLCLQHQKGKLTLNDLKQYITEEDIELAERFPLHTDGFYYNNRMQMEIENRKVRTDTSRNNGAQGGRPKTIILPNDNPKETHRLLVGNPNNNPSGTGDEDGNVNKDRLKTVYSAPDIPEIKNTIIEEVEYTEAVITKPMLDRVINKFIAVDNRFKLQSVMREIDEDYGGFDNVLELYLPNDTSAQINYKNKLKEYNNGIFSN